VTPEHDEPCGHTVSLSSPTSSPMKISMRIISVSSPPIPAFDPAEWPSTIQTTTTLTTKPFHYRAVTFLLMIGQEFAIVSYLARRSRGHGWVLDLELEKRHFEGMTSKFNCV
jgi:hypothetical protein